MTLTQEIEEAQSFKQAADLICWRLALPGLQLVEGLETLQECNGQFLRIWNNLKEHWEQGGPRVKGAVCVIFGRLSMDPAIRSKLANQDAIGMVTGLLKTSELQLVALRTLVLMTCHSGAEQPILYAIDRSFVQSLVDIAKRCTSDSDPTFVYCVTILSQTSFAAFGVGPAGVVKVPASEQPTDEDAKSVLELISRGAKLHDLNSARQCFAALLSLSRGEGSLASKSPEALKCLVGYLRHPDMAMRVQSFVSIYNVFKANPTEPTGVDPQRAFQAFGVLREDEEYRRTFTDPTSTELYSMIQTQREFSNAMEQNLADRNMLLLGMRLYSLIMSSEWAIPYGFFPNDEGTMRTDTGLPYVYFYDALPHCAHALRALDPKSEPATVLDIKYEILNRRYPRAHEIAENWINMGNKNSSYCYYALALSQDDEVGLKWAKKGLRTNPQGYIRLGLLSNAIDYAASLALERLDALLTTPKPSRASKANTHAIAYLQSAMNDAEEYIKHASLDGRVLRAIMAKYMGLYVAFKGPKTVSPDFEVLQPMISKFATTERFSEILWTPVIDTPNRATWKAVEEHYPSLSKEWDEFFASFEKKQDSQVPPESANGDGLGGLLKCLHLPDKSDQVPSESGESKLTHMISPPLDERTLERLICSECRNPSGQLKLCGRCGKERYCDPACQKRAWPNHKTVCEA